MAKKKITKKSNKINKLVSPREEFVLILMEATKKAITGQGTSIDEFFGQQLVRLNSELLSLRNGK